MQTFVKKKYDIVSNITKYNLLDYTRHSILTSNNRSIIIIPNLCNLNFKYGGPFSEKIAKEYPLVEESYNMLGKIFVANNPGYVQFVDVLQNKSTGSRLIVANMLAQDGFINQQNNRSINYGYLSNCLYKIQSSIGLLYKKYSDEHYNVEIHSYKFGTNKTCNANWYFINNLMEDILLNISNIYIYAK